MKLFDTILGDYTKKLYTAVPVNVVSSSVVLYVAHIHMCKSHTFSTRAIVLVCIIIAVHKF